MNEIDTVRNLRFIDIFVSSVIVELLFVISFRMMNVSGPKWKSINQWYDTMKLSSIITDILILMIGFYLTKYILVWLYDNGYTCGRLIFAKFMILLLLIQIIHDSMFYTIFLKQMKSQNYIIRELQSYANIVGINAIIGDSLMYIFSAPLLYYIFSKQSTETNIFITIVALYILMYFLYQIPK